MALIIDTLMAAKKAARSLCQAGFEAFGCAGNADRIVPIALESMVGRYHELRTV
jgi:fructose-bisphosphate aldolase, class II